MPTLLSRLRLRSAHALVRVLAWALCACLFVIAAPSTSSADASSGTFTGSISARGNYYWERSTRVVAPATTVTLESPRGAHMDATYLIDAITSASQATGVITDQAFTEKRNDASGGLGYEIDFGKAQLDLTARGRFSKEPDYLSRGVGFASTLSLNQRLSVLSLVVNYNFDDVGRVVRMASSPGSSGLVAAQRVHVGDLDVLAMGLSLDQVLSRTSWVQLGYDTAFLEGFQANPYRLVAYEDGGAAPENHPDQRTRQGYFLWFAQYIVKTRTALRFGYRLYRDNWDIWAHIPEVRLYQEIGPYFDMRLRYRGYTQNGAFFFRDDGNVRADRYITADPKMSRFQDQTVGLKLRLSFEFLAFTPLDFFHTAALDFGVEYIFNTNQYGNGLIGQGGLSWAF